MYKYFPVFAASKMSLVLFIAMSSTLAACSSGELALDDTYAPAAHYDRYPIEVARGPVKMEISSQYGSLQSPQIYAISAFTRSASISESSKITIRRPSGGGASGRIAKETYRVLLQSGIASRMILNRTYPGPSTAPVQLSYNGSVAVTKECGDWSSDLSNTSGNQPYPNLGCSIQNNIAAMVSNPDDFLVPEPTVPAYAASRDPAARQYAPF